MKHLQLLSLLLLLVGCGSMTKKSANTPSIASTTWQTVQIGDNPIQQVEKDSYTLIFGTDGELNGRGSCNIMFGTYSQGKRGGLELNPQGLTRAACPDMDIEAKWLETLSKVTRFEVNDDELELWDGSIQLMKLKRVE